MGEKYSLEVEGYSVFSDSYNWVIVTEFAWEGALD